MKKEVKQIVKAYLGLCDAFKKSDIWSNKEVIKAYCANQQADSDEHPILLLYEPIDSLSKLFVSVNDDNIESKRALIRELANDVWYALDCRSDVKVECSVVDVADDVKNVLLEYLDKPEEDTDINIWFLKEISVLVEELCS